MFACFSSKNQRFEGPDPDSGSSRESEQEQAPTREELAEFVQETLWPRLLDVVEERVARQPAPAYVSREEHAGSLAALRTVRAP